MSRIIKCDRCGSEIEPNAKIGYVCISEKDSSGNKLAVTNPFEELDFCTGCINAISEFVKNAGKTRKNRGGGVARSKGIPTTEEKPKRKRRVDVGRIHALANAGWPQDKIADDVGCSIATVGNVLREERSNT